jgi:hypothetical protein
MGKSNPKQKGSHRLKKNHVQKDRFQNRKEIPARAMKERRLHNLPSFERNPPTHEDKKNGGKSNDPDPPDLEKNQGEHLAGERKILPDIQHIQPRHANRRGCGEKGIDEGKGVFGCGPWMAEKDRPRENRGCKSKDEDSFWRQMTGKKRLDRNHLFVPLNLPTISEPLFNQTGQAENQDVTQSDNETPILSCGKRHDGEATLSSFESGIEFLPVFLPFSPSSFRAYGTGESPLCPALLSGLTV